MFLVTLEGLPRTCISLLKCVTCFASVPCPIPPTPTNAHCDLGEELTTLFGNVLARMLILQRHADDGTRVLLGAHWVDTPPGLESLAKRRLVYSLAEDLKDALAANMGLHIEPHLKVYVHMNVHECFEIFLQNMEARDLMLHDLLGAQRFLAELIPPPYHVFMPPFMLDNAADMALLAAEVSTKIKAWISERSTPQK